MTDFVVKIKNALVKAWFSIDWLLFVFLMLFLNVSSTYKLIGLFLLIVFRPNFKFGLKSGRLPLFYALIIALSLIQVLFNFNSWNIEYFKLSGMGIIFWGISFFVLHQMKLFTERNDPKKIHNTLKLLFLINALASFSDLFRIMLETNSLNPYTYRDMVISAASGISKYGAATGDHIYGIFSTHSFLNMFINLFGCIYFFYNRNIWISIICLTVALMTTSNLGMIIFSIILLGMILFDKNKFNKAIAICLVAVIAAFYLKVSPDNVAYMTKMFSKKENNYISSVISQERIDKELEAEKQKKIAKYIAFKNGIENQGKENQGPENKPEIAPGTVAQNSPEPAESVKPASDTAGKEPSKRQQLENIVHSKSRELDNVLKDLYQGIETHDQAPELTSQNEEEENSNVTMKKVSEEFINELNTHHDNLMAKVVEVYGDSLDSSNDLTEKQYPGKLISFMETFKYSTSGVKPFLIGSGAGRFSSKLAFGVSGFSMKDGGKRALNRVIQYVSPEFKENHLRIFSFYWLQDSGTHSVANEPFSTFNQLLGEYGVIGIILFAVFYLWFFMKNFKILTYGKYLIPLFLLMLITDYWYEHLNVIVIFELMMFLDIRKNAFKVEDKTDPKI